MLSAVIETPYQRAAPILPTFLSTRPGISSIPRVLPSMIVPTIRYPAALRMIETLRTAPRALRGEEIERPGSGRGGDDHGPLPL